MKALPSIAFNDFSGTAKNITARQFKGHTVLTVRPFPSKVVSFSQKTNRNARDKISCAFKKLSDALLYNMIVLSSYGRYPKSRLERGLLQNVFMNLYFRKEIKTISFYPIPARLDN